MSRRGKEAERHTKAERGLNQYFTPPQAVLALMAIEALPQIIWEPACGEGHIVKVLRESGRLVMASDIEAQGCPDSEVCDFLAEPTIVREPGSCGAIVTNPPFDQLREGWVERCLFFAPDVYLLARLQFLEGNSDWRRHVLEKSGLRRVYVFRDRLPMMHRKGHLESGGKAASSRMCFAWFCWRRGWTGQCSMRRISWKNPGVPLPPPEPGKPRTYCRQTMDMFAEVGK